MRLRQLKDSLDYFLAKLRPQAFHPRVTIFFAVALVIFMAGKLAYGYLNAPLPTISLQNPGENEEVFSDDLYIRGMVAPPGSKVLVNEEGVSLNGDGTFTAVLKIREGQNTIRVAAEKNGRKSEFLRLVKRSLSPDEARLRQEVESKAKAEAQTKLASQNQEIAQVQAAYTQREAKTVRVIEHKAEDSYGIKRVVGKVVNDSDGPAYWIKVTANFLDREGKTVDAKIAFVTSFDKFLKPGEISPFETQTVDKEFDHYQLEVSWEKER
ncbi:MAG: FxLYD domain-containing protein [bacterium]|nr:FxLYD domain-containing protein [bacterium]